MSVTESPANPAFDVEAERVECPLKILVQIPASLRTFLIHPDIAELTTGLWGLTKLNKKVDFRSFKVLLQLFVPLVITLISECCKPNTRDAEVRASNIVSLYVTYLSERSSFCPIQIL